MFPRPCLSSPAQCTPATNKLIQYCASDFLLSSDDLLNYDIGDVDDNDLIGAEDEDELLLSDDGKFFEWTSASRVYPNR